ncbi:phosphotransferase enzyme family protein [Celerinatantimonas yamalensis]|uniref:Phosphotransferase n=1 Tax=Celerinatantimonas yamalensis TaxID=559956 RepID=A0ABW9G3T9_9GAMM
MNTLLTSAEVLKLVNAEYRSLGQAHHCKFLRRGFNDHYLIGIGTEWYIFRVYLNHKNYIESPDAFKFELDLLDYLYSAGIPVAPASRRDNGESLGWTATAFGNRAFALFSYAEGDALSVTPEQCFILGRTAAELHLAANGFQSEYRRYHLDRTYLVDEPLKIIAQQRNKEFRIVSEQELEEFEEMISSMQPIEELVEIITSLDVSGDEFGIIHCDLHPGNIHFNGSQLTLFDFDHCAYGWRAYELALTEYMPESQKLELLKGYESVRPLSKGERDCIPVFAKLRRLWNIGDSLAIEPARAQSSE